MAKAKKCDLCEKLHEYGGTLGGSIASGTIGEYRHYYPIPRVYDLCEDCARVLKDAVRDALTKLVPEKGGI